MIEDKPRSKTRSVANTLSLDSLNTKISCLTPLICNTSAVKWNLGINSITKALIQLPAAISTLEVQIFNLMDPRISDIISY